ncbi:hypothetical protein [Auraticoccus monumenti]|uniref:hypothetical protein n=1 Tax=Auraticoccus monumenti TaxID=675864 RepID=UPI0012FA909C|nr:hypothetical protein [Auraticoccus monumenti]
MRASGQADRLLPALRDQDERVEAAVYEHFPAITRRSSSVSDAAGWAAGREAADQARLDLRGRLAPG